MGTRVYVTIVNCLQKSCKPWLSISCSNACAPNEHSDQPLYPYNLSRALCGRTSVFRQTAKTRTTLAQMHRLTYVFAGHTCNLVGNAVSQPTYDKNCVLIIFQFLALYKKTADTYHNGTTTLATTSSIHTITGRLKKSKVAPSSMDPPHWMHE